MVALGTDGRSAVDRGLIDSGVVAFKTLLSLGRCSASTVVSFCDSFCRCFLHVVSGSLLFAVGAVTGCLLVERPLLLISHEGCLPCLHGQSQCEQQHPFLLVLSKAGLVDTSRDSSFFDSFPSNGEEADGVGITLGRVSVTGTNLSLSCCNLPVLGFFDTVYLLGKQKKEILIGS